MTLSMYQASVPAFVQTLKALDTILSKAAAYAEAGSFDAAALLNALLYPDMLAFAQQVQIATDHAKGATPGSRAFRFPVTKMPRRLFPSSRNALPRRSRFFRQ